MKKFLLSLTLLCAVFIGQAQRNLWFNEIYPNPGKTGGNNGRQNNEYLELYNTSTASIPLDCYVVVSYFNTGTERGVYVYNFPTGATIDPLSHYVIASGIPIKYQQTPTYNGTNVSNWNDNQAGGYIQKYLITNNQWPAPTSTSGGSNPGTSVGANFNDFMYITTGNDASVNLLLFRINADGTATLVNSVFGNGNGNIPTAVTSLPALTVPSGSATCAPTAATPITLNFNNITFNNTETFNIGSSTGSDNGYARYGDATCGGWDKFTGNTNTPFTPGMPNPLGGTRTPTLSTTEKIICGNSIQIQVLSPTSGSVYQVEARLYIDVNKDGKLDAGDTYLESIPINSGSTTVYSFNHVYNSANSYLVVYRTSLGCFDQVKVPTAATGIITTRELNVCGNQIDFSVTAATGDAALYGLPYTVQLYENNGDVTFNPAEDVAIGNPVTVTAVSSTTSSIPIPEANKGKLYILVYTSANSCYSKAVVPPAAQGTLTTSQVSICGSQVNYTISGATLDAAPYVFPITVNLYQDLDGDNILDTDEMTPVATTQITTAPYPITGTLVNPDPTKKLLIQYNTAQPCFTPFPPVAPTPAVGGVAATAQTICGSQVDFTITGPTGDATNAYLYPMTVELYYDLNGNLVLDPEELTIMATKQITSATTALQTITNPDPTKKVILVYRTAQACFSTTQAAEPAVVDLTTTQSSLCGKRINFTVTSSSPNAAIYSLPMVVSVYHDANGNGLLDENTSDPALLLGRKTITSFSTTGDFIDIVAQTDWTKAKIIEYRTNYSCFTDVVVPTITTTGAITVGGNINYSTATGTGISTLTYFVVTGATAADAYPLEILVYEDVNKNGVINTGETVIATQKVNSAPAQGTTYTVDLANAQSSAILLARSTFPGCSQTLEAITNAQAPLPVRLVSFTAKRNKEKVHLAWETAMELNNSGFDIQRKVGNGEWKTIAFAFSQANGGNSNSTLHYEYNDNNPTKGVSQYRLRQVDIDTRATFSEIRSVRGLEQASQLLVYPNPSTDGQVNILFEDDNGNRQVVVRDMAGRVVKQYRSVTDNSLQIDGLQNGMYTLQVTNETTGETTVKKVIIKKR